MPCTKRDFEAVARIIAHRRSEHFANVGDNAVYQSGYHDAARHIGRELSRHFAATNPRFDAERFAKACEPGGGK